MRRASGGFTLIEVLIAVGLLTAVCVGIAHLIASASSANRLARAITIATIAAAEKVEQLQALPFDDPALAPSPPATLTSDVDSFSDQPLVGYRRRWSVEPLPSHPADTVVVHVFVLREGSGPLARLTTIRTRKGMP